MTKETFGSRLRRLRKERKLTMKQLGAHFGLAESTISGYENNNRSPDKETIRQFADYFGVSVDYLLLRTSGQDVESKNIIKSTQHGWNLKKTSAFVETVINRLRDEEGFGEEKEVVLVPVLGIIKAGYDLYADQQVIGMEPVAASAISDGAEYFYLVVRGDSMSGDGIRDGMRVLVRRQDYIENGKIGVVLVNGDEATLKRVYVENNEMLQLIASNSNYPPRIVPASEARIQGQVKQVVWDV